jgi:NitT/TauT family transport system substrate-binding protein
MTDPLRRLSRPAALAVALVLVLAACGDDDDAADAAPADSGTTATDAGEGTGTSAATDAATDASADPAATDGGARCGETLRLGYSAWPGWFPWAVAEDLGLFEANGLDVELTFFADYLTSLDAMVAGELDGNSQTLNDTMLGVASGDEQVIVIVNDNSTGNDAIIVDESIQSVEDLAGVTVAAEPGVVDHFLLLQGLAEAGMTESDIDFRGVPTDAAAAGFAAGEFDAVGVFAPFTLQALEREGSHVLFDSSDYPGTIPDHLVVTPELVADCPGDVQALVETWYQTLDAIDADPEGTTATMAALAELTPEEYAELDAGTTLFTAEEALAAFQPGDDTTSLQHTAELINPFLVESGLIPEEAPLDGLFDPSFTQAHVDAAS